jgi:hypothetical protein
MKTVAVHFVAVFVVATAGAVLAQAPQTDVTSREAPFFAGVSDAVRCTAEGLE